jgi:ferrous iron transport protein A
MFSPFDVTGCSLELLNPGERGIIIYCKSEDEKILKQLLLMGLTQGSEISLEQRHPCFIIKVENICLMITPEIVRAIYVRIINN